MDRSPHKQNGYLPGSRIPVKDPDRIREDRPDVEQMGYIREWGGRFIIPVPHVRIL